MTEMVSSSAPPSAPGTALSTPPGGQRLARPPLYLSFMLGGEVFAVDIRCIREIIEYNAPTSIPMPPRSVLGVINVRGTVVPVIDLAQRFGWPATDIGRRSSIVMVEVEHEGKNHVLGLVVDKVNAVTEIAPETIEPAPAFGARINIEFIRGMARIKQRFAIVLDLARTLTIAEIAATATQSH